MRILGYALLFALAALLSAAIVLGAPRQPQPKAKDPMNTTTAPAAPKPGQAVYSKSGFDITPLSQSRIDELARALKPDEAKVILAKGTEPAFCGTLVDNKKDGTYVCRLCGLPLFASDAKFDSGTGWPSFFKPYDYQHVAQHRDTAHGMDRQEILCARCGAHLGHVFDDGPRPTGLRFCLNSVSLTFFEKGSALPPASTPIKTEVAYLAGGCFWGVEDRLQQTPGVIDAVSGYMGGTKKNPTYQDVCSHTTGHAETVKVTFDPAKITYKQLLEKFFKYHDPTQLNRQGPDVGDSYRSAIFASDKSQLDQAKSFIEDQQKTPRFEKRKIETQIVDADKAGQFYEAEKYHQDYHAKHGGSCPLPEE